jgi:hypothetical protein
VQTLLFACRSVDCTLEGDDADSDGWQYPTSDGGWSSKPDTKKHSEQSGLVRRRRWVRSMHQKEQQQQQQQQQQTDETVQVSAELNFQSNSTASAANATASDAAAAESPSAKDVIAGMCNDAIAASTTAGDASTDDNSTAIDSTTTDLDDIDSGSSESFDAASEQDDWLFDSESAASESAEHSMSDDDGVITDATDPVASHDDEQASTEVAVETLLEPEPMPPVIDTAAPNIAAVPVAVLGDTLQLTQAVAASAGSGIESSSSSSSSALDSAAAVNATLQTSNTTAGAVAADPLQALQQWWDREFNFRGFGIGVVKPVFAGSLFRRQDFGVGIRLPLTSHFHSWEVSFTVFAQ